MKIPTPDKDRLKHQTPLIRVICVIRDTPRFRQPHPPGEELLHHPLLDGDGFVSTLFQCSNLGIHIGENSGDGALFI